MEALLEKFATIRVYKEGGKLFLHKPLLLLYALGQCHQGRARLISFQNIDRELRRLFSEFYPEGNIAENTHYPFGKLENDQIWEITDSKSLSRTRVGHLFKAELFERNVHGGFKEDIYKTLQSDSELILKVANVLLETYFSPEKHVLIIESVGLNKSPYRDRVSEPFRAQYSIPIDQLSNSKLLMCGEILKALKSYYAACRYQGVVLSTKELPAIDKLVNDLSGHFESFERWDQPGLALAPPIDCYLTQFCEQAFQSERKGLIIVEPENWFYQWNKPNQQAFWSHLSQHYGRYPVIVIVKDAYATTSLLERYFRPAPVDEDTARLWTSKYQAD